MEQTPSQTKIRDKRSPKVFFNRFFHDFTKTKSRAPTPGDSSRSVVPSAAVPGHPPRGRRRAQAAERARPSPAPALQMLFQTRIHTVQGRDGCKQTTKSSRIKKNQTRVAKLQQRKHFQISRIPAASVPPQRAKGVLAALLKGGSNYKFAFSY